MSYPHVGSRAPAFVLPDQDGTPIALKAFKGQWVVLYFYPKDDTSACTAQACDFRDALPDFATLNAAVLGVSPDPLRSHTKFRDKYSLPFPLLSDPEHGVLEAYGVWQEKSMYGRKYMGVQRTTVVVDGRGMVRAVYEKVKVSGHVEEVRAFIAKAAKSNRAKSA
jgi:thioredoxin-dependent peroxiredoxin